MPKSKANNLAEMAYQILLKQIITQELEPGQFLDETSLCQELGISRTPLREAIMRLKQEQMLGGLPNKTAFVQPLSLDSLRSFAETFIIIEKNVSFLAAQRVTPRLLEQLHKCQDQACRAVAEEQHWDFIALNGQFHQLISQASANQFLQRFHQEIRLQSQRFAYISITQEIADYPRTAREHRLVLCEHHSQLLDCLRAKDAAAAAELATEHIMLFYKRIVACYQEVSIL